MAYWLNHNTEYIPAGQRDYFCDDRQDIADLPTNLHEGKKMEDSVTHKICDPGSFCLCIEDSSGWILNSRGVWKEV